MKTLTLAAVLFTWPAVTPIAAAQNALDEARAQYEAAAYEEALATLTRISEVTPPANRVEVEQYRALCLIALGHMADAERAVAALIDADPMYVPSPAVASPSVLSLVAEIRKKQLPTVARGLADRGRIAFQAKETARAERDFKLLLRILDDPAMAGREEAEDLRVLAHGFVTLSAAVAATPTPAAPVTSTLVPAAVTARPAPALAPPAEFEPAVAIEQNMPDWVPPSASVARFEYNGKLRVRISTDGRVVGGTIDQASHPSYDALLLQVARGWRYKPATRDGVPVESERVIAIQLRAQP